MAAAQRLPGPEPPRATPTAGSSRRGADGARQRRVLLVDDDVDFAETVQEMLEGHGFRVLALHSAAEARNAAPSFDPHVALLDVQLKQESGLSLLSDLRHVLPSLLCVMVTAHASTDSAIEALREGAYDYVRKPFHPEELIATLGRCFERLRLAEEKREAEAQLRQSQKLEALGRLTGGVAHDFNNLLTVISGGLELISDRLEPGSEAIADLLDVREAARRAAGLTRRLLAFSRKQPLDPTVVDLNLLVEKLRRLFESTLGESIRLVLRGSNNLQSCSVDAGQLEIALLNLVLNARDAIENHGVVTVSTCNRFVEKGAASSDQQPGEYVMVSVSDDGRGMSKGVAQRAFDPFFTTKPVGKGTGLGLSMVHGFARQSGGFVEMLSEEGRGSTVQLCLPSCREAPEAAPPARDGQPERGGGHVLLVEDEDRVRATTAKLLRSLGYQVIAVETGARALARLRQREELCLLLTDVGLPGGLSGWDVARAARETRPDVGVLIMSGYPGGHQAPALEESTFSLLPKPFDRAALAAALRAALPPEKTK